MGVYPIGTHPTVRTLQQGQSRCRGKWGKRNNPTSSVDILETECLASVPDKMTHAIECVETERPCKRYFSRHRNDGGELHCLQRVHDLRDGLMTGDIGDGTHIKHNGQSNTGDTRCYWQQGCQLQFINRKMWRKWTWKLRRDVRPTREIMVCNDIATGPRRGTSRFWSPRPKASMYFEATTCE